MLCKSVCESVLESSQNNNASGRNDKKILFALINIKFKNEDNSTQYYGVYR
jgi:hypothetical protein